MPETHVYHKTAKGQNEIESRSGQLSLQQRRVLILVNGANDATELARLSLCKDVDDILKTLEQSGFIDDGSRTTTAVMARDYASTK
jgi:hypothetical protein